MKVKYDSDEQVHTLTITPETEQEEDQLQDFFQAQDSWVDSLEHSQSHGFEELHIHRTQ